MTDFELLRQLRQLRNSPEPTRDLWPEIAVRLEIAERNAPPATRRGRFPLALAAGLMTIALGSLLTLVIQHEAFTTPASLSFAKPRNRAGDNDPRLAAANIVLDAAQAELQQALKQAPKAVFLVDLLQRTNEQRRKLAKFDSHTS